MGRIRTIKPDFWRHEDLSSLPEATHMLAAALLNYADDEGYFNAHPGLIRSECCPLREPSVSIPESLRQLSEIGYLKLGRGSDGKRYGLIVKFLDHQRVNHPTQSKIKGLEIVWEGSVKAHGNLTEPSSPEGKGKEEEREEERKHASHVCTKPPKRRLSYPSDFEEFWKLYPTDSVMSKKEAAAAWSKLTPDDHALATKAIPGFAAYCRANPTYRPVHACRFLSQRRFEGFINGTPAEVEDWPRRLEIGRTRKVWYFERWGGGPESADCRVPKDLLRPSDFEGWRPWKPD